MKKRNKHLRFTICEFEYAKDSADNYCEDCNIQLLATFALKHRKFRINGIQFVAHTDTGETCIHLPQYGTPNGDAGSVCRIENKELADAIHDVALGAYMRGRNTQKDNFTIRSGY